MFLTEWGEICFIVQMLQHTNFSFNHLDVILKLFKQLPCLGLIFSHLSKGVFVLVQANTGTLPPVSVAFKQ